MSNESILYHFADIMANGTISLMQQYGIVVTLLAILGLVGVFFAILGKVSEVFRCLFYLLAIPVILILGLVNKKKRKERIKDIGEIKAHLHQHPEKKKIFIYKILSILFIILICAGIYLIIHFSASSSPALINQTQANKTAVDLVLNIKEMIK